MADGGVTEVKVLEAHAAHVFRTSLHVLADAFADPTVQEIMVNRADDVWVERGGVMSKLSGVIITGVSVASAVRALASANGKEMTTVLDCRMPGYRIAAALSPVAISGPTICIRKHATSERTLDTYLHEGGFGRLPADALVDASAPPAEALRGGGQALRDFLRWAVRTRKNLAIAGGTSSGKTTFLNALLTEVPAEHRVLTIEDTAELKVRVPNYVGLESLPDAGITIRSLVRLALRFRPDRIVVGEVRGAEAYDLLDALNTGHSGGACSLHADSPELALARLESMLRMNESAANLPHLAMREQIASAFDYVVFCSRRGARRGPERIVAVKGVGADGKYETETIFDARELT